MLVRIEPLSTFIVAPRVDAIGAATILTRGEGLAGFKCSRSIRFTTLLPRTASGKLQRAQVRSAWRESLSD